ncbi:MAG TPA: glutamate--tRNA ligase, partial [Spirochaetia bacterium]|nr:glutamate--tRNA ligase [Spirochaetia bacterium]
LMAPFLSEAGLPVTDTAMLEGIASLVRERIKRLTDVPAMVQFLFVDPPKPSLEELLPKKTDAQKALAALSRLQTILPELLGPEEDNEAKLKGLAAELGMKVGDMLMPLRVAVTGASVSPPLFQSIRLLGVEKARARTARAISVLAGA